MNERRVPHPWNMLSKPSAIYVPGAGLLSTTPPAQAHGINVDLPQQPAVGAAAEPVEAQEPLLPPGYGNRDYYEYRHWGYLSTKRAMEPRRLWEKTFDPDLKERCFALEC